MESRAISLHQIAVCDFAFKRKGWFTSGDLASKTKMKLRTAQLHLKRLTDLGILERRKAFGGCRYHVRPEAEMDSRAMDYLKRLGDLYETFGRKRRSLSSTLSSVAAMFAL
jgi:predicted transcriptional regulator